MGKAVRNTNGHDNGFDFDSAFEQATANGTAVTTKKKTDDPKSKKEISTEGFNFDQAFNSALKKKEEPISGNDSSNGSENTPPSSSQSGSVNKFPLLYTRNKEQMSADVRPEVPITDEPTVFDKSFLQLDIEKQPGFLLSNPKYNKPKDPLSLSNIYNKEAQERYDQKVLAAKSEITSTPESLAAYTQKRVDDLNGEIKAAKDGVQQMIQDKGGYLSGVGFDEEEGKASEQLQAQIADATNTKNRLKASVALEAAKKFLPVHLSPGKPFDPKLLARDIVKVADPEQEFMLQTAEKGGSLPQITLANMERMGIDLAKQYLQELPDTDPAKGRLKEIEETEKTFDDRNFELTAQRAKEKIGDYFYNKGKSGFWGYSGKNIETAINDPEAGLTENEKKIALEYVAPIEKKLFFSTDIPGSGFFRSAKNAIDKSVANTGNTISGWMGDRKDADRAFDLLNAEVAESRFRAPGDNPTWKAELSYLTNKEKKEKLTEQEQKQKVDLEKFVGVRNGWSKFRDGVGDLTGQVAEMALLSKGIGIGGRALTAIGAEGGILGGLTTSAVGNALTNETVGLFLTSYLNSYDSYKTQSLQLMPGEKNAANRDAYAKVMAGIEGLSERIFNDQKVLKAFTKEAAPAIADITSRFINKEITQQVAREELQSALKKYLNPFRKEFVKSTGQESFEEGIVDIADGMAQSIFGGQPFDAFKTGQQAVNTFLTTALYSPLVSGAAAHGAVRQNQSQNAFIKSAIVDMANNPTTYLKSVEDLQLSGQITQPEANEKIKLINSASKYAKEIPETITVSKKTKEGTETVERQLDYPEVSSYLIHRLNEGIINEKLETITDPVLKQQLEQQLKRSVEIRKGIVNNSIGVTPNIQEVTDKAEKAQDLGILDAETTPADELIGTPFQKNEEGLLTEGKIQTDEERETSIASELGDEKTKAAITQVKELVDNDLIPETVSPADKELAEKHPLSFLQFVAQQAQGELDLGDKVIKNRERAIETFGEGIVAAAEDVFPNLNKESAVKTNVEANIIFDQLSKADRSKISKKSKQAAINEIAQQFGDEGKRAAFIHSNFADIVTQLKENKKIEVKC